jgi:hypothetical protein
MKQITQEERWFLVNQLIELTEKETKHLKLTTNRLKALPELLSATIKACNKSGAESIYS